MMPLVAADALSDRVVRARGDDHPRRLGDGRGAIYAVYSGNGEDARFLGLVTESRILEHPTRILADLVASAPYPRVPDHLSLTELHQRMDDGGTDVVLVVDRNDDFLGAVTRESLLRALLRRTDMLSSALKVEQQHLRETEAKYRALAERSPVGVYTIQNNRFSYANPRLAEMLGYHRQELIDKKSPLDVVIPEERELLEDKLRECLAGDTDALYTCFTGIRKDGETVHLEIFGTPETLEGVPAVLGTVLDVTERKEVEHQLRYLAYHDMLTGLPNRSQFVDRAQQAIARAQREEGIVGILFVDLDEFKDINDTLGHETGDEVLKAVAERLGSRLRTSDTLSRWSGDEFCILLPDLSSPDECATVAQDLISIMKRPLSVGEREFMITASIGCSFFPDDAQDVSLLLQLADAAMYEAKHQGGAIACFRRELSDQISRRMRLTRELRDALERGAFFLQFQPIVQLDNNQIVSVEALLRWRHPEYGLLSPGEFVPLLERNGLMERVVDWIMRTSLNTYRDWQRLGCAPDRMAINMSARHFRSPGMLDSIRHVLEETGVSGESLELEVTEELLLEHGRDLPTVLRSLESMGVNISVDDFGTGFSSVGYLRDLPLDSLKVDRSFVTDLSAEHVDETRIVHAVLALGQSLGLTTIAEGVETAQQLDFLSDWGCNAGQGYYISPPLSGQLITDWLEVARTKGWRELVWD